jgi:hypothetical protein
VNQKAFKGYSKELRLEILKLEISTSDSALLESHSYPSDLDAWKKSALRKSPQVSWDDYILELKIKPESVKNDRIEAEIQE